MTEYFCACGECDGVLMTTQNAARANHFAQVREGDPVVLKMDDGKSTNPKDVAATTRAPLHTIPVVALVEESLAFLEGVLKYGACNWMIEGVQASVYVSAAARHTLKWFFGQQRDSVTGVHHLASARACLGILLDAESRGVLNDDRPPSQPLLDDLFARAEEVSAKLFKLYGDRKPRHFTIKDTL